MASTPPWALSPELPWHVFTAPAQQWAVLPSFVVGEIMFIMGAALALVHAWQQRGPSRRAHLLAWVAALVAGTANDLIFMALPVVDNFWQAQAMVMLTPRLPLYIPCVYVCFMYIPAVSVWRVGLPPLSQAALTGLAAMIFYAPYDIVGAKFLWWTWHDTDLPIATRLLGVPVGSTMWVVTFCGAFAWLLNHWIARDRAVTRRTMVVTLLAVAGLSSLLMVVQITALQQLDGGVPGTTGLVVVVLLYGVIAALGFRRRSPARGRDGVLVAAIGAHFVTLVLIMASFDPASHRSTGIHQTYGPCHVEASDIAGFVRYEYLCAEDYDEDFSFDCVAGPPDHGTRWYTVCGRPHKNFAQWMGAVVTLALLGLALFAWLLGLKRRRRALP